MLPELPWFIWREVIDYIISDNRQICIVNKDWFKYSAGRFMTLYNFMVQDNNRPSEWLKLAEKTSFYTNSKLNWNFIKECLQVKAAEFTFNSKKINDFDELKSFIWNSKLKIISLRFTKKVHFERPLELLVGVRRQLEKITLQCSCSSNDCDKLFTLIYPKLIELSINTNHDSFSFSEVQQSMPNLEQFTIKLANDNYLSSYSFESPIFHNLKSLKIDGAELEIDYWSTSYHTLFGSEFPTLIYFKSSLPYESDSFERISRSMPKLKILNLVIHPYPDYFVNFPTSLMSNLEDLTLTTCQDSGKAYEVELDLSLMPQLHKFDIEYGLELINSSSDHIPLITNFNSSLAHDFPYLFVGDQLINLKQASIDCCNLSMEFGFFLELFKDIPNLTLYGIDQPTMPESLPSGPFKLTHLELRGDGFLIKNFLNWLARQSQLTHFRLVYLPRKIPVLDNVHFPFLQNLDIDCPMKEAEAHLKSILTTDSFAIA